MATFLNTYESDHLASFMEIEKMLTASVGTISGVDMNGREYEGIEDLWNVELNNTEREPSSDSENDSDDDNHEENNQPEQTKAKSSSTTEVKTIDANGEKGTRWYDTAYEFWESEKNCPTTDDGVLGGYGRITPEDVKGSNLFLDKLAALRPSLSFDRAGDCGAGIGRVTKHLLLHRFNHVDIIEQSPRLTAAAPEYIGEMSSRSTCIVQKLQDFTPEPNTYDVFWIQWVMGHLHDHDVIAFYRRLARGLKPGGVIILKDNCSTDWTFVVDTEDNSVARCLPYIRLLINLAGLEIVMEELQTDFPSELYPVTTFAIGIPAPVLPTA
jgi:protein N-terminal methyltransferase